MKLDHVTAIVADADAAASALRRLIGAAIVGTVELAGMRIQTLRIGDVELHVNAPTGPGQVQEHFQRHGASLHHLAFRVEDLDATLSQLQEQGFSPLGMPVQSAPGLREVFIDPQTTGGIVIQLVQRAEGVLPEKLDGAAIAEMMGGVD